MLKMRLQRVGRKHEPSFRLVLTDSKNSTKSGRFDEVLGSYDPRKNTETFKADRIKHWLSQGIGLTPSVNNLLVRHRIISGKKVHVGSDFVVKAEEPEPVVEEATPVETPETPEPVAETLEEAPVEAPTEAPVEAPTPESESTPQDPAPLV